MKLWHWPGSARCKRWKITKAPRPSSSFVVLRRKNRVRHKRGFRFRGFPERLKEREEKDEERNCACGQGCGFIGIHMDSYGFYVGPVIKLMHAYIHVYGNLTSRLQGLGLYVMLMHMYCFFGRNHTSTHLEID